MHHRVIVFMHSNALQNGNGRTLTKQEKKEIKIGKMKANGIENETIRGKACSHL